MDNKSMQEKNEQYKDCPVRVTVREINGHKYIVHSHFVGTKDLDEVLTRLAFERAMNEIPIAE